MNNRNNDINLSLSIHESILIMREHGKSLNMYGSKSNEILEKYNDKNIKLNNIYNEINNSNEEIKITHQDSTLCDNLQFNVSLDTSNVANFLIEFTSSFIIISLDNNNSTGIDNKLIEIEKINNYFSLFCINLSRY
jgi:hypothetical protein